MDGVTGGTGDGVDGSADDAGCTAGANGPNDGVNGIECVVGAGDAVVDNEEVDMDGTGGIGA